jgi:hypothetical protein
VEGCDRWQDRIDHPMIAWELLKKSFLPCLENLSHYVQKLSYSVILSEVRRQPIGAEGQ